MPLLLLWVFWTVGIVDIAATATLIHMGIFDEWNPILLWFFRSGGLATMVLYKLSIHSFGVVFIALCIEQHWIDKKRARVYIIVAIIVFLAVAVPAYVCPFVFT